MVGGLLPLASGGDHPPARPPQQVRGSGSVSNIRIRHQDTWRWLPQSHLTRPPPVAQGGSAARLHRQWAGPHCGFGARSCEAVWWRPDEPEPVMEPFDWLCLDAPEERPCVCDRVGLPVEYGVRHGVAVHEFGCYRDGLGCACVLGAQTS